MSIQNIIVHQQSDLIIVLCHDGFCISEASVAQWHGTGKVCGEKGLLKWSEFCLCYLCKNARINCQINRKEGEYDLESAKGVGTALGDCNMQVQIHGPLYTDHSGQQ